MGVDAESCIIWVTTQLLFSATLLSLTFGGGFAENEGVARNSATFGRRLTSRVSQSRPFGIRSGKSLARTFPFNQQHDHQHHHHDQHEESRGLRSNIRGSRQGSTSNDVPLDIGSIAAAGERCIDKVVMTQETEYDNEIICKHSYSERCHITYKTDYEPQQEEECDENYRKNVTLSTKIRPRKKKFNFVSHL